MSEIELLRREVDRGNGAPASHAMIKALNIAWGPYQGAFRRIVQIERGHTTDMMREARLRFISDVVGHPLASTYDLTEGEARRVLRWLSGYHPSPNVNGNEDPLNYIAERMVEVVSWLERQDWPPELRVVSSAA